MEKENENETSNEDSNDVVMVENNPSSSEEENANFDESVTEFDKSHIPVIPLTESIEEQNIVPGEGSAAKNLADLGVSAFNLEDVERNVIEQVDKAIEQSEEQAAKKDADQSKKIQEEIQEIEKVCCNHICMIWNELYLLLVLGCDIGEYRCSYC